MAGGNDTTVIVATLLGAAAVVGLVYYVTKSNAPASSGLPVGTQVSSLQSGVAYDLVAVAPSGVTDSTSLTSALTQSGWSNITVNSFSAAPGSYYATATWAGSSGSAVPAGLSAYVH